MKIKVVVLLTSLALTGCTVENKEGDTVIKPEKETVKETTIIDKTKSDNR